MKNKELFITTPTGRVFRAVVRAHHVALQDGANNNDLFVELGICDKTSFCATAYGYRPTKGNWPWFRENDFAALKRLLKALCDAGCTITETGETQKKHLSKPTTYRSACQTADCQPCREQPSAKPTSVAPSGYVPKFRSPLTGSGITW